MTQTISYALFKDGKQISKQHSTINAAIAEAYSHGAIGTGSKDFGDEPESVYNKSLANGYEIREIKGDTKC